VAFLPHLEQLPAGQGAESPGKIEASAGSMGVWHSCHTPLRDRKAKGQPLPVNSVENSIAKDSERPGSVDITPVLAQAARRTLACNWRPTLPAQ